MSPDNQIPEDPNLIHPSPPAGQGGQEAVLGEKSLPRQTQGGRVQEDSRVGGCDGVKEAALADSRVGECNGAPVGIHNRPPIPGAGEKAECPKFMSHGPCGGVRKGGYCEVFPAMMCPWVVMYFDLEKLGKTEWMTEV